jgi:DNA replication and repair protein RecF
MKLTQLAIHRLRNLDSLEIDTDSRFNVFYGDNGAGKTSILEAIHLLSHGRSFRGTKIHPLIQHKAEKLWVTGKILDRNRIHQLGIERTHRNLLARIDNIKVKSLLELAERFPTLVLHPDTFNFLSGEPSKRRAFLDWGVFYEDPCFLSNWKLYRKALRQRNSALRKGLTLKEVSLWNESLSISGEYIDRKRKAYIESISLQLPKLQDQFKQKHHVTIKYRSGWSLGSSLIQQLEGSIERDLRQGYTQYGPHRGDFRINLNSYEASEYASRGQLKLINVLLKLAQCSLFVNSSDSKCILLLDDLSAEFDKEHYNEVLKVVSDLGLQSFISTIRPIDGLIDNKLFHVKQGGIKEVV